MSSWQEKLFIVRADLSIKLMNGFWPYTPKAVDGLVAIATERGVKTGAVLDLCCGNGRISINLAERGFHVTGVDFSAPYLEDARLNAERLGVADKADFVYGDVRQLSKILEGRGPFDLVVSAWTSMGYYSDEDDLETFRQARQHSREGALLFVLETMHEARAMTQGNVRRVSDLDDLVMVDDVSYNPLTSRMDTVWSFYRRRG
ncbi:MAG: class I SAM-dependent methyltransferase, partial [Candidatus Bathyarchaeota archaeon]|nr:class I SAM-dependent methyltransferase [Candidatus Bathyarchaeota archaeon]